MWITKYYQEINKIHQATREYPEKDFCLSETEFQERSKENKEEFDYFDILYHEESSTLSYMGEKIYLPLKTIQNNAGQKVYISKIRFSEKCKKESFNVGTFITYLVQKGLNVNGISFGCKMNVGEEELRIIPDFFIDYENGEIEMYIERINICGKTKKCGSYLRFSIDGKFCFEVKNDSLVLKNMDISPQGIFLIDTSGYKERYIMFNAQNEGKIFEIESNKKLMANGNVTKSNFKFISLDEDYIKENKILWHHKAYHFLEYEENSEEKQFQVLFAYEGKIDDYIGKPHEDILLVDYKYSQIINLLEVHNAIQKHFFPGIDSYIPFLNKKFYMENIEVAFGKLGISVELKDFHYWCLYDIKTKKIVFSKKYVPGWDNNKILLNSSNNPNMLLLFDRIGNSFGYKLFSSDNPQKQLYKEYLVLRQPDSLKISRWFFRDLEEIRKANNCDFEFLMTTRIGKEKIFLGGFNKKGELIDAFCISDAPISFNNHNFPHKYKSSYFYIFHRGILHLDANDGKIIFYSFKETLGIDEISSEYIGGENIVGTGYIYIPLDEKKEKHLYIDLQRTHKHKKLFLFLKDSETSYKDLVLSNIPSSVLKNPIKNKKIELFENEKNLFLKLGYKKLEREKGEVKVEKSISSANNVGVFELNGKHRCYLMDYYLREKKIGTTNIKSLFEEEKSTHLLLSKYIKIIKQDGICWERLNNLFFIPHILSRPYNIFSKHEYKSEKKFEELLGLLVNMPNLVRGERGEFERVLYNRLHEIEDYGYNTNELQMRENVDYLIALNENLTGFRRREAVGNNDSEVSISADDCEEEKIPCYHIQNKLFLLNLSGKVIHKKILSKEGK